MCFVSAYEAISAERAFVFWIVAAVTPVEAYRRDAYDWH